MKPIIIAAKIALAIAVIAAFILSGDRDYTGLIFVLLGGVGTILMSFSFSEMSEAIKHAAGEEADRGPLQRSAYFFESAARNFLIVGVFGTIVGYVLTLGYMDDPKTLGPALAIAFMTTLYGTILGIFISIPALSLNKRIKALPDSGDSEDVKGPRAFRFEMLIGYILFLGVMVWGISPGKMEMFMDWPPTLLVVGGTVALVILAGKFAPGRAVTICFALTGFLGSLSGLVRLLQNLNNPKGVGPAMAFTVLSCFMALLGMILVGLPMEDRSIKTGGRFKDLVISRIAWYGFPVVTLIVLTLSIATLVFIFSNAILK
jgi:flagellar motor component MotA